MWKTASSITGSHGAYIIAIKGKEMEGSTVNINDLKYIILELGIDSGISGSPLTLSNVKLNFDDFTSTDKDTNIKTAMARIGVFPTPLCYRVVAFADNSKEYKTGTLPVSINITTF
jgi:hypothetical protein